MIAATGAMPAAGDAARADGAARSGWITCRRRSAPAECWTTCRSRCRQARVRHPRPQRHRQERHAAAHHRPGQARRGRVFVEGDEISALDGPELSRVRRKRWASCSRTRRSSIRSRSARTWRFRCGATPDWRDVGDPRTCAREAGGRRARAGLRQDAGGALGRHAEARRPGAGDGARSAHPAGGRAERRPRSDHRRRDRRAAARAEAERRRHARRRHAQHSERAADSAIELLMLHEGRDRRRGHGRGPRPQRRRAGARLHGVTARGVNQGSWLAIGSSTSAPSSSAASCSSPSGCS